MFAAPRRLGTLSRRALLAFNTSRRENISVLASSLASPVYIIDAPPPTAKARPCVVGARLPSRFQVRSMASETEQIESLKPTKNAVELKVSSAIGDKEITLKVTNMEEVYEKVSRTYGLEPEELSEMAYTLQIGAPSYGSRWRDFKSFGQALAFQHRIGDGSVFVQVKEIAQDYELDGYAPIEDLTQDYPKMMIEPEKANEKQQGLLVRGAILDLMDMLKKDGWRLPDDSGAAAAAVAPTHEFKLRRTKDDTVEEVSPEELVLLYAGKKVGLLRDVLVSQCGAFNHIALCLRFRFMWEMSDVFADPVDNKGVKEDGDWESSEDLDEASYEDLDDEEPYEGGEDVDEEPYEGGEDVDEQPSEGGEDVDEQLSEGREDALDNTDEDHVDLEKQPTGDKN